MYNQKLKDPRLETLGASCVLFWVVRNETTLN
jgi:hypothetical protein